MEEKEKLEIAGEKRWEVILEDWKMSKDRISFFDNALLTIRISGLPIILVIIGIGFTILDKTSKISIPIINCNGAAIPFLFAIIFTLSLFLLDLLHFVLLLKAVDHAKKLENSNPFKDFLKISNILESKCLTILHLSGMVLLYASMFSLSVILTLIFWNYVPPN